ncbi:MAG: septum formation protein Maf [Marinilabiliales bacterium]|nr:MAG: septum formation protein Maf [Marinilabiliales bacterium]
MLSNFLKDYKLILASNSPRRRLLLSEMGLDFELMVREIEEVFPQELNPEEAAIYLAKNKASAFKAEELLPNKIIITADTVVALGDLILGKPEDKKDAVKILESLSARSHDVITGICIKSANKTHAFAASTKVYFKELSSEEIEFYIDNFKPYDKAGAYGIQEWIGHVAIERIEGSYFNVMGLPTHVLYEELMRFLK